MANEKQSVFATLSKIDCSEHTETINNGGRALTYLSWAWAWHYCKENYPDATYTIYENEQGIPYFNDGRSAWVKTGVTIQGIEHIEYLPIMDNRHHSIPLERITSFDMNTAIQRSLTKAVARHGLGLYIYAGEDLPLAVDSEDGEAPAKPQQKKATAKTAKEPVYRCGLTQRAYMALVAAVAEGRPAKGGGSARDAFINNCKPTPQEIDDFDNAVFDYEVMQAQKNLQPNKQ